MTDKQPAQTIIKVENLSKTFRLPHEKNNSLKTLLINFRKRRTYEKQEALKNISFEIKEGEFFGIVGRNGSGKSTLLKLLAGTYTPTEGNIIINKKLTPFIELGVGFNPELTGRENVYLNGALLGFNRKEMDALYDDIVDFAELERFMDQKLKNYSSGMQVRLAFSIAIRAKSDILLLDEVLAVGDALFQKKCYDYFKQLKKDRKTVVFVSHDSSALLEYCDRGILIEKGKILKDGKIETVVNDYIDILNKHEEAIDNTKRDSKNKTRWGTGQGEITEVRITAPPSKQAKKIYTDEDESLCIRVLYKANEALSDPVYGITIVDSAGQRIFTSNTLWSKVKTSNLSPKQVIEVSWTIPNVFNTGTFLVSPAIADSTGSVTYDWLDEAAEFKIRKKIQSIGYINPEHEIIIS